jgi:hypothetical protein
MLPRPNQMGIHVVDMSQEAAGSFSVVHASAVTAAANGEE